MTVCYENDSDGGGASISASGSGDIDLIASFSGTTEQVDGPTSVTLVGPADWTGALVSFNGGPTVNFQPGPSFS